MATRKSISTLPHRLRLIRDGFEFEAEGDLSFVLEMIERFVAGKSVTATVPTIGKGGKPLPEKLSPTFKSADKAMSVREFILRLESKKHTDLVLAFGYYLEKQSNQSAFAPADINNLYYEAKLDTSNTSQMIIQNIKRGYIMEAKKTEAEGKKQYVLTNSGEKYIEGLLAASET